MEVVDVLFQKQEVQGGQTQGWGLQGQAWASLPWLQTLNLMRPQASINLEHGVMIQAVEFEPGPHCREDRPSWSRGQRSTGRTEIAKCWGVRQEKGEQGHKSHSSCDQVSTEDMKSVVRT